MTGYETTIAMGSHGQLLVTVPKQVAQVDGFGKGTKVVWRRDRKRGRIVGEVILNEPKE